MVSCEKMSVPIPLGSVPRPLTTFIKRCGASSSSSSASALTIPSTGATPLWACKMEGEYRSTESRKVSYPVRKKRAHRVFFNFHMSIDWFGGNCVLEGGMSVFNSWRSRVLVPRSRG